MTHKTKNTIVLARAEFPLSSIQLLTCRHVLVAGGGGSANTGIPNGFECYELLYDDGVISAKKILRYETKKDIVMNCAVLSKDKHLYIAAGQGGRCQLYKVKYCMCSEEGSISLNQNGNDGNPNGAVRNRKNNCTENHSINGLYNKSMTFQILVENTVQTDFSDNDPLQRVVRVNSTKNLIVTGGTDGHIRIWEFPSLKLTIDIGTHKEDILDLDFDPTSAQLVSVLQDGTAAVWDITTGNKIHDLKWFPPNGTKYSFKRCRFTILESDPKTSCLFMITNPTGYKSRKLSSQVQLWNSRKALLFKKTELKEDLSALAVRNDGRFIAVATFVGSIYILTSFSLQVVLKIPKAHNSPVTGLEFLPVPTAEEDSYTTLSEASVISISTDKIISIHNLPYRSSMPSSIFILLVLFFIIVTFIICDVIGL